MYKVLIADDEPNILAGLSAYIPWASLGFEVAATVDNGRKVLEYLERHEVDLMLLDVQMPVLTGLEVMEIVAVKYPAIRAIILSGYAEFPYAQQAMSCGVTEYLLKPLDIPHIGGILRKMKGELDAQREQTRTLAELQLLRYMKHAAAQEAPPPLVGAAYPGDRYRVVAIRELAETLPAAALTQAVPEGLRIEACMEDDKLKMVLIAIEQAAESQAAALLSTWKEACAANAFMAVSPLCGAVSHVPVGCRITVRIMKSAFVLGYERPLFAADLQLLAAAGAEAATAREVNWGSFQRAIRSRDEELLELFFAQLFSRYSIWTAESSEPIFQAYHNIVLELQKVLKELGHTLFPDGDADAVSSCSYEELKQAVCYTELHDKVRDLCRSQMRALSHVSISRKRRMVDLAQAWIETNYAQNFGLETFAEMFNVSKEYFSTVFKEETATNFNEYLKACRMRNAVHLMKTGPMLKIYEIACQVGYPDAKYFCRVFKLHYGQHPEEYRRKIALFAESE